MHKFFNLLACPACNKSLSKKGQKLVCSKNHVFDIKSGVPIMAKLSTYQEEEAKAWEDEWEKGVSKKALGVYKKNMKVFKKLGFWEESGETARLIPSDKKFKVLDIGCGNGKSTAHLVGETVIGLDLSESQMVRAKSRFKKAHFIVGDAEKLPFRTNSFDLVVAINLLHHINNPDKVLKECHRVLKRGGKLLTVDPNFYNPIGYTGRGLYRLLHLKKVFPAFPQFALGEDERQFSKGQYYDLFTTSPFKKFIIKPHRLERILFFSTILVPSLYKVPYYEALLIFASKAGNALVKIEPIDRICYFWLGEAEK